MENFKPVSRGTWKDERNELIQKIQAGNILRGFLVALSIVWIILLCCGAENSIYSIIVLANMASVAVVLLVRAIFSID